MKNIMIVNMKNIGNQILQACKDACKSMLFALSSLAILSGGCTEELLNQTPTTQLSSDLYWKTTSDAVYAVNGIYNNLQLTFGRDYNWDGAGDLIQVRNVAGLSNPHNPGPIGDKFDFLWKNCYATIGRANVSIENIRKMKSTGVTASDLSLLNQCEGEARFLRAIHYFRLIDLWGDVPFFTKSITNAEAYSLERTSRSIVKDTIISDLAYAASVLPKSFPSADRGRATKMAALGFSGKVKLFWACWMKNENKITESAAYYADAAKDFKEVMNPTYGLALYMNGDPGTYHTPNYFKIFQPDNESNSEVVFSVTYAAPNLSLGENMLRCFGTRVTAGGECWVNPTSRLVNKYQLTSTGDYAAPLVLSSNAATVNGSINPVSYVGRDWRMKASMLWDGQKYNKLSADGMQVQDSIPLKFRNSDGVNYINYGGMRSGYVFRKWVRVVPGWGAWDGPQDFYLMRLPDVWLMYCEAVNETSGPSAELFTLVNKIRARGMLPALDPSTFSNKDKFFKAIEQERIIELAAEGMRFFDIRRWKMVEQIWSAPSGLTLYDSWGDFIRDEFKNAQSRDYLRYYIFKIPESERSVNPNLTQNDPWL